MGNRECGRREVQRDVLRYVLREMRWLASPFVDWARSRGGVHSRHDQLLVPRASSEGVWAFLCRCCMRSRVATTARPAPEADENTEFPVLTAICPETCVCACPLPLGVFFDLLTLLQLTYACRCRLLDGPHPPRSRTRQPRPPSGQPPGSVSASLLVPRCRFAAPGPCSGGGARIRIAGEAAHSHTRVLKLNRPAGTRVVGAVLETYTQRRWSGERGGTAI